MNSTTAELIETRGRTRAGEDERTDVAIENRELVELKDQRGVSVVLPALDEQDTVAAVIESIAGLVGTVVDEFVVRRPSAHEHTAVRSGPLSEGCIR
ncbi:hypothetical protein [Nocardia arizonensis]|uniref:hypothetical protein n=1 Tax=Nocardia arizonensis TaxID=1141647 RepID=UPI0006D25828